MLRQFKVKLLMSFTIELFDFAFSLGKYSDEQKKYEGKELPGWKMKEEK